MELLLDVVDGIELQSPSNGARKAGLFYIVHTGLTNTHMQMKMLHHDGC